MYRTEAIEVANSIDQGIIQLFQEKKNFRVEAGAGSGKTHSLMNVIKWIQDNKKDEFEKHEKKVACITFTNAAVDIILSRLNENSFIIPSTIHTFAWSVIKQFQGQLLFLIKKLQLLPSELDFDLIQSVQYTLGIRYFNDSEKTIYIGHNDVLSLFSEMLDNEKFRKILAYTYPIILIDEYQDSNKEIIDKFIKYYISCEQGIQFGFFGDSWQTIYQSNGACGLIEHEKIHLVNKSVNFRSTQKIVDVLNTIRPQLPQQSALEENSGRVIVITTDNYKGPRRQNSPFKDDLPTEVLEDYVSNIKSYIYKNKSEDQSVKILMITHRMLAEQQGYTTLISLLGDGLKNADDKLLCFVSEKILPLMKAIREKDILGICDVYNQSDLSLIKSKDDKLKWASILDEINDLDEKSIFDVLDFFYKKIEMPFPNEIEDIYKKMKENSSEKYPNDKGKGAYFDLKNVKWKEFYTAATFIRSESLYSTDHGVKGEEYDSVLFVIGKGWNLYQFDKWMPESGKLLAEKDKKSFERNRNLFYVCCSRAKKNLILFVTIPIEGTPFRTYLENLVGSENIITYEQYLGLN